MAEEENGQEKTEEATPKRLEKAREEGQIVRSRELGTTLLLMTGGLALLVFGGAMSQRMQNVMKANFGFDRAAALDPALMFNYLAVSVFEVVDIALLILVLLMLAGVVGSLGLGGWLFSTKPLLPKLTRLNPIEGLKRMFSTRALVELFKAIAKFLVVSLIAILILLRMKDELLAIGQESLESAIIHALWITAWSAIGMAASTILIAAVDVPFQIFDNAKKLRMTRQQVKDEFKDSEGKPEVKSRVRQLQRELAQSRMMAAVPDADVVITNPEHFSVALKYEINGSKAPVVVAKGADEIAMKIREIANLNQVPLIQSPLLARAVYFTTELDDEIPEKLYLAVAQVLAFVFQLNEAKRKRGPDTTSVNALNRRLNIPPDMKFDTEGKPVES